MFSNKAKTRLFGSTKETSKGKKSITSFSAFLIIALVIFNSYFTYAGAYVILSEKIPALFIAITIQIAIAITLLSLPYVRGVGKIFVISSYFLSMFLSVLFAFTYTHDKYTGNTDDTKNKIQFAEEVTEIVSKIYSEGNTVLNKSKLTLEELKRAVNEELNLGRKSKKGAGKGDEYYKKEEEYQEYNDKHQLLVNEVSNLKNKIEEIKNNLRGDYSIQDIIIDVESLNVNIDNKSLISIDTDIESISALNMSELDKSLTALKKIKDLDSIVIIGVIVAIIFDLIALLIGVIRSIVINTNENKKNIFEKFLAIYKDVVLFRKHIRDLPGQIERETKNDSADEEINSHLKTKYFIVSLLSSAYVANDNDDLTLLQDFKKIITPIHTKKGLEHVGILFEDAKDKDDIKALISDMIRFKLITTSPEDNAYLLSNEISSYHLFNIINKLVIGEHKVTEMHQQVENYFKENTNTNKNGEKLLEFSSP